MSYKGGKTRRRNSLKRRRSLRRTRGGMIAAAVEQFNRQQKSIPNGLDLGSIANKLDERNKQITSQYANANAALKETYSTVDSNLTNALNASKNFNDKLKTVNMNDNLKISEKGGRRKSLKRRK
jgi:hypothetical protein